MILEFSSEAGSDLKQIADCIAQDNPRRALSLIQGLPSKCEDLVRSPNSFALVPRDKRHGIRRRVHGNYLIFYRVETAKVVIVHLLHGAIDYGAILFGNWFRPVQAMAQPASRLAVFRGCGDSLTVLPPVSCRCPHNFTASNQ